jgi:hypothetical protein
MLACCQEKVFANERTAPNTEAVVSSVSPIYVSPDFMRNRTWLDMFKVRAHFWGQIISLKTRWPDYI